jgi:hypothetical protein
MKKINFHFLSLTFTILLFFFFSTKVLADDSNNYVIEIDASSFAGASELGEIIIKTEKS